MSRPVKKLFDIEIDEVSVVDRAANQHSLIAFSKAVGDDQLEESMPDLAIYDETDEQVDVDDLQHGDVVYDEQGNEYVFVEDGADDDDEVEDEVGKADLIRTARIMGKRRGRQATGWMRDNPGKTLAGGVATGALAGGGTGYALKKSLGESVLEELSKAVTEKDREEIIAKAMDEIEIAKAAAQEAWEYAESERDIRIESEFISKAATYNLPVSPDVLGPILKSMAEVLTDEQLDIVDELFNSVGDALYNEIGYVGESSNSSVINAVDAYANELVGKSDLTHEQAMVAMLEANPAAYDAYISEKGN